MRKYPVFDKVGSFTQSLICFDPDICRVRGCKGLPNRAQELCDTHYNMVKDKIRAGYRESFLDNYISALCRGF